MKTIAAVAARLGCALALSLTACTPREQTSQDQGPAPVDTSVEIPGDTSATAPMDTLAVPDTGVATPPITPPPSTAPDTPPAGAQPSSNQGATGQQGQLSQLEYEGWRQYSVNCSRCHGQDVLPNPVAANLLVSVAPGGPMASESSFTKVVSEGRPERGMPAFKSIMSPDQIRAVYTYVKGRAEKRIPPGRPASPTG
ncbi:MAG TPA: c-type cytochrome [Gemmatimonadales bacterium]|nr:c-type cytochrome [Gemmatimonadales bacterium]